MNIPLLTLRVLWAIKTFVEHLPTLKYPGLGPVSHLKRSDYGKREEEKTGILEGTRVGADRPLPLPLV